MNGKFYNQVVNDRNWGLDRNYRGHLPCPCGVVNDRNWGLDRNIFTSASSKLPVVNDRNWGLDRNIWEGMPNGSAL